jgi:hypothetical protein
MLSQAQRGDAHGSSPAGGAQTLEIMDPSYIDAQHVQELLQELKVWI